MSVAERVLEPGAADAACEMAGGGFNSDHEAMEAIVAMSTAISLKRIADALELSNKHAEYDDIPF